MSRIPPTRITMKGGDIAYVADPYQDVCDVIERARRNGRATVRFAGRTIALERIIEVRPGRAA